MEWRTIDSAPLSDEPILLAAFSGNNCLWSCAASWGTATPGYIQCASYSGWFPMLPALANPIRRGKGDYTLDGDIIGNWKPPTHWMQLPIPPA